MNFQKVSIESQNLLSLLHESAEGDFDNAVYSYLESANARGVNLPNIPENLEWLNVSSSKDIRESLREKLLLLDFFTYCCINCMHVLPNLHALEQKFSINDGLAVLGIHSAKFPNEKLTSNILSAVLRYDITHPVLNDPDALLWNQMDIQCWPTFVFVSPAGKVLLYVVGEAHVELLPRLVKVFLDYYKAKGILSSHELPINLEKDSISKQSLLFPGKICLTDSGKLVISDTGHHRVIVAETSGMVDSIIGNGIGDKDGAYTDVKFNSPQGVCYHNSQIYVSDTENHKIRRINIIEKNVTTLAGTGNQGSDKEGGKSGTKQEISSPWDVVISKAPGATDENLLNVLYIAMAGTHQIWSYFLQDGPWLKGMSQKATSCLRFSGNGNEENRNNSYPHKASFAQPSGLSLGEFKGQKALYIADAESSSVRIVDLKTGGVKACVGGDRDPMNLFAFGDEDGKGVNAKLQHPLAVAWEANSKRLYVTDSYNHKIKVIDPAVGECKTLCGTGNAGLKDGLFEEAMFNEPGGLSCSADGKKIYVADTNNHVIRVLDLIGRKVSTLRILDTDQVDAAVNVSQSVEDPTKSIVSSRAPLKILNPALVANQEEVELCFKIFLPSGCHYTDEAPSRWRVVLKDIEIEEPPPIYDTDTKNKAEEFDRLHAAMKEKLVTVWSFHMNSTGGSLMTADVLLEDPKQRLNHSLETYQKALRQ